jgi:nucleoside-diphosphate-sugar epimerase
MVSQRSSSVTTASLLALEDLQLVLVQTAPLWEEMRGQCLFVSGGTGFFGCWLLESFCHINRSLGLGARAVVLTRDPETFRAKCPHLAAEAAIRLVPGDVREFPFPEGDFPYVIHAATETNTGPIVEAQRNLLDSITRGTERMLRFGSERGTRKFLFVSSGAVYGRQPVEMTHVPESYSGAPNPMDIASAYGEGKRLAELLCALYGERHEIECKIARCWAFCGPHLPLDRHFAIGNFIGDALAGRAIRIAGDGTPRRSYLYAADLAIWLWTMLFRAPPLTPVNIGSDRDVSILELARMVAGVVNPNVEVEIAKSPVPGLLPSRYVPSIARAKELLGLSPLIGLEDAIRRTAAWNRRRIDPEAI